MSLNQLHEKEFLNARVTRISASQDPERIAYRLLKSYVYSASQLMLSTSFNKLTPQQPSWLPLHASALRRSAQVAPDSTAIARFLLDSSDGFLHLLTPTCEVYVIPFLASRNPDLHWFK